MHASVSNSCFHVKSSIFTAPKLSSSVSMRFGIGFIAPLGRSRSLQVHVHRRREHVAQLRGRQDREEREERDDVDAPQPPVRVARAVCTTRPSTRLGERVADERPLLERRPALERDAQAFDEEAGDADDEERAEDHRVFGLGLDADAVRALHVAAHDRPADADEEHDARRRRRRPSTPGTSWPCRNLQRARAAGGRSRG